MCCARLSAVATSGTGLARSKHVLKRARYQNCMAFAELLVEGVCFELVMHFPATADGGNGEEGILSQRRLNG